LPPATHRRPQGAIPHLDQTSAKPPIGGGEIFYAITLHTRPGLLKKAQGHPGGDISVLRFSFLLALSPLVTYLVTYLVTFIIITYLFNMIIIDYIETWKSDKGDKVIRKHTSRYRKKGKGYI
jgi:hypothetical protein